MCRLELPEGAPEFRTTLTLDECGIPIVSIFGEIDLATLNTFRSALSGAASRAVGGYVIVDVRGTEFMDVGGVKTLLDVHDELRILSPGGRLLVVGAGQVKWLIELLDLEERLYLSLDLLEAKNAANATGSTGGIGPSRN